MADQPEGALVLREDAPGQSPHGVSGALEQKFFDAVRGAHDEKMRRLELGGIGAFLGGEKNAPTAIAFIFGIIIALCCVGCLILAGVTGQSIWSQLFERSLTALGIILAYVFGRGSRNS